MRWKTLLFIALIAHSAASQGQTSKNNQFPFTLLRGTPDLNRVGVSPAQISQLQAIHKEHELLQRAIATDLEKQEAEFQRVLLQPQLDAGAADSATQGMAHASDRLFRTEISLILKVRQVLTDEQWSRLVKGETTASNEASATATLRTLNTCEVTFASTYNHGFTDGLNRLGQPDGGSQPTEASADLADPVLSGQQGGTNTSITKNGYRFTYTPSGGYGQIASYSITAEPIEYGVTGTRGFFTDQSAVIRWTEERRTATASDRPLGVHID